MDVIATAMGFYDGVRRREGEVFEVAKDAKASWFKPLPKPAAQPEDSKETQKRNK